MGSEPAPAYNAASITLGALDLVELTMPYRARVRLQGTAPILFHRYDVSSVSEKAKAAKGSKAKKEEDPNVYVYRTASGHLGLPGLMFAACIREAGRREQDPSSPRKSMVDLLRSCVIPLDVVAPFEPEITVWEYLDASRAVVQRGAVTRIRPALREGWVISFTVEITAPEYVPPLMLKKLIDNAGRYNGLADYRPVYGRFTVTGFDLVV